MVLISPKVKGGLCKWELISAEKKAWEWSWHLHYLSSGSDLCCRKGNAMKPPPPPQTRQRHLTLQQFITSATSVRGLKSCDAQPFCPRPFLPLCCGWSGGCLNKAEFAQVPEDELNAACCIRCHALSCITWTSVATCLDPDLLCVSNMWIKRYWGKSRRCVWA